MQALQPGRSRRETPGNRATRAGPRLAGRWATLSLLLAVTACLERDRWYLEFSEPPRIDAGTREDGGPPDAGAREDGGPPDAGAVDAGVEREDGGLPPATVDAGVSTCTSCHGADGDPAPPPDTRGRTDPREPTVGAHRSHLRGSTWIRTPVCADCHRVPDATDWAGHVDEPPAEIEWSAVATAGGVVPRYEGGRCWVYCHGATLAGGEVQQPEWTRVDGTQARCGSCHGVPMPAPHPRVFGRSCGPCHPFEGLRPIDPSRHADGIVDVRTECTSCHGGPSGPAPPPSTTGETATTSRGVGAHQAHLNASTWRAAIACSECHEVPAAVESPGHIDGDGRAEVTFGARASSGGASPAWDGVKCTGVYCHGATLSGGTASEPVWTEVGAGYSRCGACHGLPPTRGHPAVTDCLRCHPDTLSDPARFHVDGVVQVRATCGACHAIPPPTGSHLAHAGRAEATYGGLATAADAGTPAGYAFGCGHCHPLDPRKHRDGTVQVELYDPTAPAGSLKARHPQTARYAPGPERRQDEFGLPYTLGTCSDTWCHSGTQVTAPAVPRPGTDFPWPWNQYPIVYPEYEVTRTPRYRDVTWGGPSPGCDGCHAYPPRTRDPDNAAGAGDSHSWIDASGYENLHNFGHILGPIPCRTCHAATVSEVGTFTRDAFDVTAWDPIPITGFDRHVNGTADVAFTQEPVEYCSWSGCKQIDLAGARYDSTLRRCTGVPCHLQENEVTWGTPYRWDNSYECNRCHRY